MAVSWEVFMSNLVVMSDVLGGGAGGGKRSGGGAGGGKLQGGGGAGGKLPGGGGGGGR